MENNKIDKESNWSKFVSSFEDYVSTNPFVDIDEVYMTTYEKSQMYNEATSELKAKIELIRANKKKKNELDDTNV